MITLTNENIDDWVVDQEEKITEFLESNCPETVNVSVTVYEPKTPHFSSYDSWKLASPDDYYNEKEVDVDAPVDDEEVYEYIRDNFADDIELGTYDEEDLNTRVEAAFKKYMDIKLDIIKDEYESGEREVDYEPDDYEPDYD